MTTLGQDFTDSIHRIGRDAEMDSIMAAMRLVAPLQQKAPFADVEIARDLTYGDHERHRLDVFTSGGAAAARPVFLFVHGGGFIGGDKAMPGSPFYNNIGAWAARNGMVGVNITYRLAPQHQWPAGADDLAAAVEWVRANISAHGGDPARIFVAGTSAGAVHVASYLAAESYGAAAKVSGGILLSCLFDMPTCEKNPLLTSYFGEDESRYPQQSTLKALAETSIPLLVTLAEFDPIDFERQALAYVNACFEARGEWPNLIRLMGHNHFTTGWHIGTADDYLANQMLDFIGRAGG